MMTPTRTTSRTTADLNSAISTSLVLREVNGAVVFCNSTDEISVLDLNVSSSYCISNVLIGSNYG
jgi:hypothetical protein